MLCGENGNESGNYYLGFSDLRLKIFEAYP